MMGRQRNQQGQALIEFTLFVVFLLMLAGATLDVGRLLLYRAALSDAAQEGAAYGAVYPTDEAGIQQRILDNLQEIISNPENVTVEINYLGSPVCAGNAIEIKVSTKVQMLFPLTTLVVPDEVSVGSSAIQTILRPPCP